MKPGVGMDYTILSLDFNKKLVWDGVFFTLPMRGCIGASMNMQAYGYSPAPIQGYTVPQMEALMQIPTKPIAVSGQEQPEEEAGLGKSEVPLDASTKASLAAMFGDDD